MATKNASIAEARHAKDLAKQRLANVPGVVGIGLTRRRGGYAVKVNLQEDNRELVPDEMDGVPVVTEVVGKIGSKS